MSALPTNHPWRVSGLNTERSQERDDAERPEGRGRKEGGVAVMTQERWRKGGIGSLYCGFIESVS